MVACGSFRMRSCSVQEAEPLKLKRVSAVGTLAMTKDEMFCVVTEQRQFFNSGAPRGYSCCQTQINISSLPKASDCLGHNFESDPY